MSLKAYWSVPASERGTDQLLVPFGSLLPYHYITFVECDYVLVCMCASRSSRRSRIMVFRSTPVRSMRTKTAATLKS